MSRWRRRGARMRLSWPYKCSYGPAIRRTAPDACEMFACTFFLVCLLVGGALSATERRDAYLRLYHGSIDNFTEARLEEAENTLSGPMYNDSRGSVFIAHGFTGRPDGPAMTALVLAYLGQDEYNVFLLDWEYLASVLLPTIPNSYLNWAAPNARELGLKFANALLKMSSAGLRLENTHLVGHSLGAHIFGIAGNNLTSKNIILPWITGLDPASIGFENKPVSMKLYAGSARFVEIIHTDPSKYGYRRSHGTVDFWANYNNRDLCSHNRSWQLYEESIKQPGSLIASYGKNYRSWKNTTPLERKRIILTVGAYIINYTPGNYYFTTNSFPPYGLGEDGT
ncbi:Lipase member H-A [Eumeta japonica]|uniref:Lipase member H-A n=1 Tax=Eumeta variegata TaxID=151549 RepID=A0A4C1VVW1_EUMVA|nr:Lipase member H-A [Eumeta japonica]